MCGVLGHLAPLHRCARLVPWVACAVSWATWLLCTGVPARCAVLRVPCPGPLGSCAPVCPLGVLCCVCGVLGHLAPVHRCARSVRSLTCAVSWATWLLFTGVPACCAVLHVRCPGPHGSRSPLCPLGALSCMCGVLGHLTPVHRCARSVHCVACVVSSASWLLFTGVLARCIALCVRCPGRIGSCSLMCPLVVLCGIVVSPVRYPGPLGSYSPVCLLGVLCCVCGALGHLAPFVPVCSLGALCCVCSVLGHLAPLHHRSVCRVLFLGVCCDLCAVSWATRLLFTGVLVQCVVSCVWCPGPLSFCSPVCSHGVFCCVYDVLSHFATVQRCARSLRCVAFAVSCAPRLLFTGVPARCAVLCARCGGSHGSCSPVCPLGTLSCVCRVLARLTPVHWCVCSVRCVACVVSLVSSLLFTGVLARCVALCVLCPGPLGSCSPGCLFSV